MIFHVLIRRWQDMAQFYHKPNQTECHPKKKRKTCHFMLNPRNIWKHHIPSILLFRKSFGEHSETGAQTYIGQFATHIDLLISLIPLSLLFFILLDLDFSEFFYARATSIQCWGIWLKSFQAGRSSKDVVQSVKKINFFV